MSYLKNVQVDRLTLPSDPTCWVEMKRRASYGDVTAAQRATVEITSGDAARLNGKHQRGIVDKRSGLAADFDGGAYLPTLIARLIVDWNLDGPAGKLEITPENLGLLDSEDGEFLQAAAVERSASRPAAEQEDFTTPSSESSPLGVATPTTRTLPVS